jgi:3-methyladenine DNA glycosylase AlkD
VPALRTIAKRHRGLPWRDLGRLLRSSVNEERALALEILILQHGQTNGARRASLFKFYMRHRRYVNNWNPVDGSAPAIVGPARAGRNAVLLDRLATSGRVWDRRIAMLSTFHPVKRGRYGPTLRLCRMLRRDPHDLIHKACGWMLREVGKRDPEVLERFLRAHHACMPRTMLRYATERLPAAQRLSAPN